MSVRVTNLTKAEREQLTELGLLCLSRAGALDLRLVLGSKELEERKENNKTIVDMLFSISDLLEIDLREERGKDKEKKLVNKNLQPNEKKVSDELPAEYFDFLKAWSELAPNKPQVRATTKSYQQQFTARWRDPDFREQWKESLLALAHSPSWQDNSYYNVEFFLRDGQKGPHWRRGIDGYHKTEDERFVWRKAKEAEESESLVIR